MRISSLLDPPDLLPDTSGSGDSEDDSEPITKKKKKKPSPSPIPPDEPIPGLGSESCEPLALPICSGCPVGQGRYMYVDAACTVSYTACAANDDCELGDFPSSHDPIG
jgi:hypothetical protein